ncbi:tyrosine-type recombinase/integrase [Peribacillus castrilensis]|uniref:tyrosine-type recombinase/integrase n=1 Tax=Bacillaceae TaxID=186817 RepID=UPI001D053BEB|nr:MULTISPECIES: tyrosine-type recombinase/integrase [Bacillaceae]MCF7620925.1 tyrosine-type recombinase/integrase [Peribacillus frigoritolerans]MCP1096929.1 tyrosine-type recombinase/integrase [Bacillaceae bacterium OS4b]MCP1151570.1 tyrosine-type recombinase/integrase [Peribacillus frigoritolerans]MCT1391306.1 tyrosine-type recombinase/integrase [Peribacillus frigoritolerans]
MKNNKEEIEKLIRTIRKEKTFISFRDEVIILVFLDTGVRLSELVGIEVDDVRGNIIIIRRTKNLFRALNRVLIVVTFISSLLWRIKLSTSFCTHSTSCLLIIFFDP